MRARFVVQRVHGPDERPGTTARYPRATSRGRRVRPGEVELADNEGARFGSQAVLHTAAAPRSRGAVRMPNLPEDARKPGAGGMSARRADHWALALYDTGSVRCPGARIR